MQSKTFHAFWLCAMMAVVSYATPYNTIILDGRPTEYDATELRGTFIGENTWAGNVITNLYVTWDATYLYIALQGWELDDKLVVMLDVDPGNGTGATTTTNWVGVTPDYIQWNCVGWQAAEGGEAFGLDFMVASEGFYNNIVQVLYDGIDTPGTNNTIALFDHGNASTPVGSPVDMAVQADDSDCDLKGFEARIPWSVLYPENGRHGDVEPGEIVPRGATIRLFANIHNNAPNSSFSSPDVIPDQSASVLSDYTNGLVTTDVYIDVVIDSTDDGIPDNFSLGQNPPFLRDAVGKAGSTLVYARFNKPVTAATATNTANWTVNGMNPVSVTNPQPDTVFLFLNDPLPAAGNLVDVRAEGVEDSGGLSRETYVCMFPNATGLDEPFTVRFVLETASGMGPAGAPLAHGATNFFLNGATAPLEWGFPPSTNTPVANTRLGGSLRYADVIFPPGTPLQFGYKFSARLTGTGTNNYEAVRLDNYLDAERVLTLNTNAPGGFMIVTNRLGAAAAPLRGSEVPGAYTNLYRDARRGDGGVSVRKNITFQLDLSAYDTSGIQRVMVQGSDPLRGFNWDGAIADWLGGPPVPNNMMTAGIALTNSGGGIFKRTWALTPTGTAADLVPNPAHSLVSGGFGDALQPYVGQWIDRRTPRSFKYQYFIVNEWGDLLSSPGFDIEVYIEPGGPTNIVFDPFVWGGPAPDVPLDTSSWPATTNSPTVQGVSATSTGLSVSYTNLFSERHHLIELTDDLRAEWRDYGMVSFSASGTEVINFNNDDVLFARVVGTGHIPHRGVQWTPNPAPETGGVARIYFRQHGTSLAGDRGVRIVGEHVTGSWGNPLPMTFAGGGVWYYDLSVPDTGTDTFAFKIREGSGPETWWPDPGGDILLYRGEHPTVSWSPNVVQTGQVLSITFDTAGGPLASATSVYVHSGFDEQPWVDRPMTNVVDTTWAFAITVPTNVHTSFGFVFNNGAGTWYSESSLGGRKFMVFVEPLLGE